MPEHVCKYKAMSCFLKSSVTCRLYDIEMKRATRQMSCNYIRYLTATFDSHFHAIKFILK